MPRNCSKLCQTTATRTPKAPAPTPAVVVPSTQPIYAFPQMVIGFISGALAYNLWLHWYG